MTGQVLIAGVGNLFLGDDGFGVAVARTLADRVLPAEIRVADFGIRGYDLACALVAGYRAVVVVDAVSRGLSPGTVVVLEPDLEAAADPSCEPHAIDPARVIGLARAFGEPIAPLVIVGCQVLSTAPVGGELLQLSPAVREAVEPAADAALKLARERLKLEAARA